MISTLHTCNLVSIMARECTETRTKIVVRECIELSNFINSVPSRSSSLLPFVQPLYPFADKVVSVAKQVKGNLASHVKLDDNKSLSIYNPVIGLDFKERTEEHCNGIVNLAT